MSVASPSHRRDSPTRSLPCPQLDANQLNTTGHGNKHSKTHAASRPSSIHAHAMPCHPGHVFPASLPCLGPHSSAQAPSPSQSRRHASCDRHGTTRPLQPSRAQGIFAFRTSGQRGKRSLRHCTWLGQGRLELGRRFLSLRFALLNCSGRVGRGMARRRVLAGHCRTGPLSCGHICLPEARVILLRLIPPAGDGALELSSSH